MDRLEHLEQALHDRFVAVFEIDTEDIPCMCGKYGSVSAIGINRKKMETRAEQYMGLAHELAHLETETYREISERSYETVARDERRAWDQTIEWLVPYDDLVRSMTRFDGRVWEIAEDLGVPEDLIRRAFDKYKRKGLIAP